MKFIRDIISEKRGLSPAGAPATPVPRDDNRLPSTAPAFPPDDAALSATQAQTAPLAHFEPADAAEPQDDDVVNLFPESGDEDDWSAGDPLLTSDWDDGKTGVAKPMSLFDGVGTVDAPARARPVTDLLMQQKRAQEARLKAAMAARAQPEPAPSASTSRPPQEAALAPEDRSALPQSLNDMPFVRVDQPAPPGASEPPAAFEVPPPASGRGASRSGRVKTRLLGFDPESLGLANPFEKPEARANDPFPVGWLVVVAGPGRGAAFALHDGVSRVGRGEDQTVCLNFGDTSISRENHVTIAYDSEQSAFFIGQSGRSNIVRLNNKPLLSTEQIRSGDQIRVGETTLRLAALCGEEFSWTAQA